MAGGQLINVTVHLNRGKLTFRIYEVLVPILPMSITRTMRLSACSVCVLTLYVLLTQHSPFLSLHLRRITAPSLLACLHCCILSLHSSSMSSPISCFSVPLPCTHSCVDQEFGQCFLSYYCVGGRVFGGSVVALPPVHSSFVPSLQCSVYIRVPGGKEDCL